MRRNASPQSSAGTASHVALPLQLRPRGHRVADRPHPSPQHPAQRPRRPLGHSPGCPLAPGPRAVPSAGPKPPAGASPNSLCLAPTACRRARRRSPQVRGSTWPFFWGAKLLFGESWPSVRPEPQLQDLQLLAAPRPRRAGTRRPVAGSAPKPAGVGAGTRKLFFSFFCPSVGVLEAIKGCWRGRGTRFCPSSSPKEVPPPARSVVPCKSPAGGLGPGRVPSQVPSQVPGVQPRPRCSRLGTAPSPCPHHISVPMLSVRHHLR